MFVCMCESVCLCLSVCYICVFTVTEVLCLSNVCTRVCAKAFPPCCASCRLCHLCVICAGCVYILLTLCVPAFPHVVLCILMLVLVCLCACCLCACAFPPCCVVHPGACVCVCMLVLVCLCLSPMLCILMLVSKVSGQVAQCIIGTRSSVMQRERCRPTAQNQKSIQIYCKYIAGWNAHQ